MNKILICVGARPNLMKASSLFRASKLFPNLKLELLHTGQHYSNEMDRVFFEQLQIPNPTYQLQVGSGSHAVQTADVMKKFEPVVLENNFDLVVVIGDINSTVACALVAKKLNIPVAHVESGLRSFDMKMPEEINRRVVDHISDYLFTTEVSGNENLVHEGIDSKQIYFVGNTMIDTLIHHMDDIRNMPTLGTYDLKPQQYAVLTLHRPSNVDDVNGLTDLLSSIVQNTPKSTKIVFPAHPRTKKMLESVSSSIMARFIVIPPQPYFSFMALVRQSHFVMTDSGGIQEETTYLKKPCFTLRANTERPCTVKIGSNFLIDKDLHVIEEKLASFSESKSQIPELWDGNAGKRILDVIAAL